MSAPTMEPATSEDGSVGDDRGAANDHSAAQDSPGRRRLRRIGWGAAAAATLALIVVITVLGPSPASNLPLSTTNAEAQGARAVAQILQNQGVSVTEVRTTAAALSDLRDEGTLVVINPHELRTEQQQALAESGSDILILGIGRGLDDLTEAVSFTSGGAQSVREANCQDDDAVAARTTLASGPLVSAEDSSVEICFADDGESGLYATWSEDGQDYRLISNPELLTNDYLDQEGNAALALRAAGAKEHVTWYLPSPEDDFGQDSTAATMPLLSPPVIGLMVVIGLALILWRGRRLGPVVSEHLPVVVKASEATTGRARLYRHHQSYSHAGSALRAGAVASVSRALGLAPSAGREEVASVIAAATGRPVQQIDSLLYGQPPTDDATLVALATALDIMESEVHHS